MRNPFQYNGERKAQFGHLLMASSMGALALGLSAPAFAQDSDQADDELESSQAASDDVSTIIVTGIRGSLQRNLDAKRNAPGVIDVISAEDIGKFPDANIGASLQRVPGVSIQRSGPRGEPTGITVRGFGGDFNETLFNGRRISTATGGRSVDFSTIGADFVGSVSVLKTPDVTLGANSIGATVNIEFPEPFDYPGLRIAGMASGSIQDASGEVTPTGGVLISNTFADGTFGILGSVVYSKRDTQANRVFVSGWPGGPIAPCQLAGSTAATCNPTTATTREVNGEDVPVPDSDFADIPSWFEQQYGATQIYTEDERIDGRLALQWSPNDDVVVTLDNNYSQQKIRGDNFGFGIWFNQGGLRNIEQDENGTIIDFTQAGTQTDFTAGTDRSYYRTNQTGLNIEWQSSDNLSFEVDGSYSKSWLNPDGRLSSDNADIGYAFDLAPTMGIRIIGDSSEALPELYGYGPNGDEARFADPSIMGSHVTVRSASQNTDELMQGKFIARWEQDDLKLQAGGTYIQDEFKLRQRNTFVNNYWQAYSGYGPDSGGEGGVEIPSSIFNGTVSLDGFIPGFEGALPPEILNFTAQDYQAVLTALGNPQATNIPGYNYGCCTPPYTGSFDLASDNGQFRNIKEKSWALFVRAAYETEISEMPFYFNAGLRQENTNLTSGGIGQVPVSITRSETDPTLLTVTLSDPQPVSTKSSYSYLLPSVDMKLELTPDLHLRFDASRTLTRPQLNRLSPVTNVGTGQRVGALTANGGSPTLRPYLSENFDAAAEWYYAPNSYAVVNFFLKNVSNFIVGGTTRQTINDVIDPTTGQPAQFSVTQQVNGPDATVRGVELALQHVFGDTGFGFNANGTLVNTNKPYDAQDISTSGFAVTGLANSANFVGFYDKNGFQARVAVNWRDEYLLQIGQNQNTGAYGSEPTFVDEYMQVDFSTSYDITPVFTVFGEVLNITNEVQSTHGRFSNQLLDVFDYGRRYTAGVRARF